MSIWNGLFWKDVAERVISTVAQVLLGLFTADGFNLLALDFNAVLVTAAVAAAVVVLKAVVANELVKSPTVSPASLVKDDRGTGH